MRMRWNGDYIKLNADTFQELSRRYRDGYEYAYLDDEPLKFWRKHNVKVIYNDPATILFVDGEKYISKAHDEKFDKEKGLLMCLAKAQGISHLDLKKMIDSAKVETKVVKPKNKKEKN